MTNKSTLSLVVPVFNEADSITPFINKVKSVFSSQPDIGLEIIFINDGSSDQTLENLIEEQTLLPIIKIIDLSRNFGKEAAITAGLEQSKGDAVVVIDVDLQDPPELILPMLEKWQEGFEVVLACRSNRESDSWLKRASANGFYWVHNLLSNPKIPANVGDFRLMDRVVVEALKQLPETHRFMKGLFSWVGFNSTVIHYSRPKREFGVSKFNGWKLWNFALEGLTSFSTDPLRIWTYIGLFVSLSSFLFAVFIAIRVVVSGVDVPGYASIMVAVTFLGGLQLIGIGVLGEYMGRTYIESKRRPNYIIRKIFDVKN
ncbi:glycosyltransferase family 2 protein [Polynucleobacter sp. UB-Tiil-W10]|uniref:glycosyltransferase family 2 protein n=1 Tax=Polynucleobacter sp. UB-Tiil-W10 TaxID=1855648 RepID=UPI001C0BEC13|nr:glycosyltransferase family 2 protein [Polynucleobacter sp. UB-Tiil-W10]MBU3539659.1 glycosyltransferase family 2 protein [Polynucleobacter sp. UB-Tiil-W10]